MAHRNIHYYGRGANRYESDSLIAGVISVKLLKKMFQLQRENIFGDNTADIDDQLEDLLEETDNYFECQAILEDLSEKDFLKVVDGASGFVYAEEIWFGIGGTITKAKIGFAEENFNG